MDKQKALNKAEQLIKAVEKLQNTRDATAGELSQMRDLAIQIRSEIRKAK